MSFLALDIPDRPAELVSWLERHLIGLHLGTLVASLEACQPPVGPRPPLADVLGDSAQAVLQQGLTALSESQRQMLLKHPRLLLELQERILVDGQDHWRSLPVPPDVQRIVDGCFGTIEARQRPDSAASQAVAQTDPPATIAAGGGLASKRTPWRQVLSIAALLLVGLFGWWQFQKQQAPGQSGWGWNKPGALASNVSAPEYLTQLASGAEAWFNKRPDEPTTLRQRLDEFREGCDTLIAAPHDPLAEQDREWLVERCRVWRGKIEGHLAALENGTAVLTVREEADATVNALMKALRTRADEVSRRTSGAAAV